MKNICIILSCDEIGTQVEPTNGVGHGRHAHGKMTVGSQARPVRFDNENDTKSTNTTILRLCKS